MNSLLETAFRRQMYYYVPFSKRIRIKIQSTYWPKERNTSKLSNYKLNQLKKNV